MKSARQIFKLLILVSFVAAALFSFTIMSHDANGRMTGDCPFSAMSQSLCPQNVEQTLLAILIGANPVASAAILSLVGTILLIISTLRLLLGPPIDTGQKKIRHWLSLLENSPASA